jgi:hypothetical protein
MKRWLTFTLTLTVLMAFTNLGAAQQKAEERIKLDRFAPLGRVDKAPKLMTGTVTQVNPTANTFTVMAKGKAVTFAAAKLKALPNVGEILDITYTETPGGSMEATTVKGSKSNSDN